MALGVLGFAQGSGATRMMLVEEFTNASCPPCAAANPAFNALLNQNVSKVAAIKYQTNWPGADPMNAQTQTLVAPRVTYYAVSGVPDAAGDGNFIQDHPANWNQGTIDTRSAVASPFTLNVSHVLSADFDSVYITIQATAVTAVNASGAGAMKLRVAMTEREIAFTSAPGTNGEKEFFDVMRDMYPNANGTVLNDSWAVNATQTFTFSRGIPTYVYDKSQIGVVAFIQDDGSKEVHQAGKSEPIPFAIDVKGVALTGIPGFLCGVTTTTANFELKNVGANPLTSATLDIKVDGTSVGTQPWTGNLAAGASTPVVINNIPVTGGSHTVQVVASVTGDNNTNNNAASAMYAAASAPSAPPIVEGFETATFPPANWAREDVGNDGIGWERRTNASGFGASTACVRVYFYQSPANQIDNFYLPKLDLSNAATAKITFDRAYAQYQAENDKVEIQGSTDCGATWNTYWTKSGAAMATAPATTSSFVPTATQWAKDSCWIGAPGNADVQLRLKATSAYGNNALFDNFNVEIVNTVGIDKFDDIKFGIYPNPAHSVANLDMNLKNGGNVTIQIANLNGQIVKTQSQGKLASGAHKVTVDTDNLASGTYMITVDVDGATKTQFLNIQ